MPGGDGTGPLGEGPMTGGGFGYCGQGGRGYGRGYGMGRGFGRGFRFGQRRFGFGPRGGARGWGWFQNPVDAQIPNNPSSQDELTMLREDARTLESEAKAVHERIRELEARQKK
ncbi:MAG: DUF5320 domain-containing protein [Candidatus Omnitrophica bacterium]|nr:DUF5320 domain-containing protein [Candidatus Omnitrophota bacterium]